uniref:Uncharacterized protein n=1 Tax=Peronospora matthiolae TaxID=2874970 RepID=A0AAV1U8T1_9STRA
MSGLGGDEDGDLDVHAQERVGDISMTFVMTSRGSDGDVDGSKDDNVSKTDDHGPVINNDE